TQFGGGKSTGVALIYASEADLKKFEVPIHPLSKSSAYCSRITEKFVLALPIRSRNLPGSNGNKGRTGVRSSEGLIRKRQLVRIKRGRNRRGILLCACTFQF